MATYAPFGTPVTPSGTEKFKYAGEMLVGAAGSSPGIYYIGARWMDPESVAQKKRKEVSMLTLLY